MVEAGDEALISRDFWGVQRDDLGSEVVIFCVNRTLIDAHVQIEIRRFDASEPILTGVLKFATLIAEQAADVCVELIHDLFDVLLPDLAHECLCRSVIAVWHVMVL